MSDPSSSEFVGLDQRDAILTEVLDSSPCGAVLTDSDLNVLHVTPTAATALGTASPHPTRISDLLESSRLVRPERLATAMADATVAGVSSRTFQIAESPNGEDRCLVFRGEPSDVAPGRWVWWLEDVTNSSRVQRLQLLAEIGRAHDPNLSTTGLSGRLVESLLNSLGVDITAIMLGDETVLRVGAVRGVFLPEDFRLYPEEHPYLLKALRTGLPVIGDGSEWGEANSQEGTHHVLPLTSAGEVLGTLHLTVIDENSLEDATLHLLDRVFLEALSAHVATALANNILYEEVREERTRLRAVVDHMPHGVIMYDAHGEVLLSNDAAHRITERSWSNLNTDARTYRLRASSGELLRRTDWPFFKLQRDPTALLDEEVILDFGDHEKFVSVSVIPIPTLSKDAVPGFLGTLRDITEERAHQAERESFMSVLSHELRSPLTPLTGFLQMVRKQAEAGDELDTDLLRRAERQVQRLGRLLDRVLDLNRLERGLELERDTLDLTDLLSLTVELWRADPRGVIVDLDASPAPVFVSIDPDRIEQVVTNLVDNAIKHSKKGDTVRVSVSLEGAAAVIRVHDVGTGIAKDRLPRIFDRFYSADGRRAGLGIGLYITRQIVRAHDGEISVRSTPGRGSTFEVRLPTVAH